MQRRANSRVPRRYLKSILGLRQLINQEEEETRGEADREMEDAAGRAEEDKDGKTTLLTSMRRATQRLEMDGNT
ncbi:hypothetical protein NDU88_000429 [Pleurodeles waltl]|uniref:Uncharacterized protein n=1 Tax=Pleurodeles waltl TaxID=8319 RepID=A0AAV7TFG6_PLEWA|nr:hypothetical protein NDU88_000429 [Pleurodeles waltl]